MRYRMNGFGWFAVLWIAVVSFALLLSGCGGGGGSVIGQPASSHNQGTVHGENFAWGEAPPRCSDGYHEECPLDENGIPQCSCAPNP